MADLVAMNRFFTGALTLFPFPLPQCRESADFAGAFKTFCTTNESTKQLIERLIHARREMTRVLADNVRYEEKLAAADQYLPLLFTLQESWTQRLNTPQLPPIKLDRDLTFEWRLYVNGRPELFKTNEFVFEIIMTYHFKALCHYYIAQNLIASDPVTFLSEAGKQMLLAVSVMDLLHTNISSNKWLRKFHATLPNPPETSASVAAGFSAYFRACAQAMATIKAIAASPFGIPITGSPPPKTSATVKARLCLAVVNLSHTAYDRLINSNSTLQKFNLWMNEKLLSHITVMKSIFNAMVRYSMAQIHYEKTEIGICLGFLNYAKIFIAPQRTSKYEPLSPGMPPTSLNQTEPFSWFSLPNTLPYLSQKIEEFFASADRDNKFVHFQLIPATPDALPPLPQEACIMNPQTLTEPTIAPEAIVPFMLPQKGPSFFSSFFGGGGAGSSGSSTNKAQTSASTEVAAQTSTAQAQPGTMMSVPSPHHNEQAQQQQAIGAAPLPPFAQSQSQPSSTAPPALAAPAPAFEQYNAVPAGSPPYMGSPIPAPAPVVVGNGAYNALPPPAHLQMQQSQMQPQYGQQSPYGQPQYVPQPHMQQYIPASQPYVQQAPYAQQGQPMQTHTVPPQAVMSDEEYARQLQRQFDAEANRSLGLPVPPYNGASAPPPPPGHM